MVAEEGGQRVERDEVDAIVEIDVPGARNEHQLLGLSRQLIGLLAELAVEPLGAGNLSDLGVDQSFRQVETELVGKGDQGAPGGNPDSKNYSGGGRGTGIAIKSGLSGRYIAKAYSYTDDFNENAVIAVDLKIDQSGNVVSATYQPRGSTSSDSFFKTKAVEMVRKSKFNANPNGAEEQTGTVLVRFKVRG